MKLQKHATSHAAYLAVYYHASTNRYIEVGEDCAAKMDMGDIEAFNPLRRAITNWREAEAGKRKAQGILTERGTLFASGMFFA